MCSSRDTPCALFGVGLCGYWLRAWAQTLVRSLGADFGADFGYGLGADLLTGCADFGCGFFAEGAKPQNRAFS